MAPVPAGPKGHPLLGHVPAFRDDPIALLTSCAREFGDIVPLRFGPKRTLFLSHPDFIEYVLVTNSRNFVKSIQFRAAGTVLGNGLVLSEGDFWRRQRRLMQPAFHPQRIATYGETMTGFATRQIDHWRAGETVDIHHEMTRITMEIVCKTLFRADVRPMSAELGAVLTEALECFTERVNSLWLFLPDTVPTPANIRLHRAVRRLDAVIYGIIEERRSSTADSMDIVSMLLNAQDEDGSRMTDKQVRDELATLFIAGHETTAVALTWTLYLLSQHPEVMSQLVHELDTILGGRAPTVADIPKLKFTKTVVDETLRLYPPVVAMGREALADCVIGGVPVRRGTTLLLSMWTLHRDPRYFEEPDAFRPERWADGLADRLPRFAYFPFSGGPRQCIGAGFAMMEATLILATIVQRFALELVPGQDLSPWVAPTVRPRNGLNMIVQSRERQPGPQRSKHREDVTDAENATEVGDY